MKRPGPCNVLCSGSSQEAGMSGVESGQREAMGEDFTELLRSKFTEGLIGHGGDLTFTSSERKRIGGL